MIRDRPLFLRVALVNSLYACCLVAAGLGYDGGISGEGKAALGLVLALYAGVSFASLRAGWLLDAGKEPKRLLGDIAVTVDCLPAAAMLGTVAGFLIALSADVGDLQSRATGAATALSATFVGIACWLVGQLQYRMLTRA